MEYWLFNYGVNCPQNWNSVNVGGEMDCWVNSSSVSVPPQQVTYLPGTTLSGSTANGADEIILEPVMNFIPVIDLVAAASCYGAAWKDGKAVSDRISK